MKRLCTILLSLFLACTNNVGTNDEILTGARSSAVIFEPNGKIPAEGAMVKIFNAGSVDGQYASVQTTNTTGRFSLKGLAKGSYNVWAEKDSLVTFQSSVIITSTDTTVRNDTLACPSTITGIVGVQPQDDPRTVTIQVVGLDKYFNNTDKNGRFILKNMAKGDYSLLLKSTQQNYTPTTAEVTVDACKDKKLNDTLWLTYTGIPIVTGLTATYDTAKGAVLLSWNATDYRDVQAYLIYRDFCDSIVFSTIPFAARSDTVFKDQIFDAKSAYGAFSISDTNDYHFRYRVAIRNNVNAIGQTFRYAEIMAISPCKVATTMRFSSVHIAKGLHANASLDTSNPFKPVMIAGITSINDTMLIIARASNPTRNISRLSWSDGDGNALRTITSPGTQKSATDSVRSLWKTTGIKYVTCTVTDEMGMNYIDTARISVVPDMPKVRLFIGRGDSLLSIRDSLRWLLNYAFGDTIPLHVVAMDGFGSIVKVEWNFGASPGAATSKLVFDTFAIAPNTTQSHYPISVRVTDDDGYSASDSIDLSIDLFAPVTYNAIFRSRIGHHSVVFNEKLWVLGGHGISLQDSNGIDYATPSEVWYSENGSAWTKANSNMPSRINQTILVFKNKLWSIGGSSPQNQWIGKNDVWSSSDGVFWTCVTDSASFPPRSSHSSVVFDNKMWVIGGLGGYFIHALNDVWSSEDGVVWTAADSAAFSVRFGHSSVAFAEKMWVIGRQDTAYGNVFSDVWSSTNGANWTNVTTKASFLPLQGSTCLAYNNKMWIIGGGKGVENTITNEIWNSSDGVTWNRTEVKADFSPRAFHSSAVFRNRMWVIGGEISKSNLLNDVWRSGPLVK
jgi:hypothetical protein